jgi:hypothetical protein
VDNWEKKRTSWSTDTRICIHGDAAGHNAGCGRSGYNCARAYNEITQCRGKCRSDIRSRNLLDLGIFTEEHVFDTIRGDGTLRTETATLPRYRGLSGGFYRDRQLHLEF